VIGNVEIVDSPSGREKRSHRSSVIGLPVGLGPSVLVASMVVGRLLVVGRSVDRWSVGLWNVGESLVGRMTSRLSGVDSSSLVMCNTMTRMRIQIDTQHGRT
jgi:hypothetical protein